MSIPTRKRQRAEILGECSPPPCVTYHMSSVTCQVSGVRCHMSDVMFFSPDKVMELVGGGSVTNRAYPVQFILYYERVQPFGLTSLSCNWVILHNEIDQMQVKIQLKPTGIVTCYKNISKKLYVAKKENNLQVFKKKKRRFPPNFNGLQCFNKNP